MTTVDPTFRSTAVEPIHRRKALDGSRGHVALLLVAVAVLVGAALRIVLAGGDLWLDEIWSLRLVGAVTSPGAVFWGISHDNNHLLNSLWLYALGPDRPSWAYRAPAVLLGTLSIVLAARIGARRGRAAGVATAWIAATALPLVLYGSEARGYAGLIFATLLAIEAFERAMGEGRGARSGWRCPSAIVLGVAIGFGTLSHLTMLATLAALGLTALLSFRRERRAWRAAIDATLDLFAPSLVALVPALAALITGIVVCGGFTVGGTSPFTLGAFATGYGDQLRFILGLPITVPFPVIFGTAGMLLAAILWVPDERGAPRRQTLIVIALLVLPCGMGLGRLPNLEFPRYFLVPGLVLMLAVGDLVGRLWDKGSAAGRLAAGLLLCASLVGHIRSDTTSIMLGRGHYGEALALMAAEGRPVYTADNRFMVQTVADFTAARQQSMARYVPLDAFCSDAPDWLVDVVDDEPPRAMTAGPPGCRIRFDQRASFPTAPLSGMRWTLYRRVASSGLSGRPPG